MQIQFARGFKKQYNKAPEKIKKIFQKRLKFFIKNPNNPVLNNHRLKGKLAGYCSINITGDWRAIYLMANGGIAIFLVLGTHSQVYK